MAPTESPTGAPRRRGSVLLRGLGFALAIILGGIAIWLIATSDTVKSQRIGALAGMWGALVGAYSVFGARRHDAPAEPGTALEVRQTAALARPEDAASQREFQARLEAILRREVQETMGRELAGLRNEVSALRSEILENVGGQMRLERTETTRLFGSNLEALQREVNQLKVRQFADTGTIDAIVVPAHHVEASAARVDEPAVERPAERPAERPVERPVERPAEPAAQTTGPTPSGAFPPFRPLEPMRPFGPRNDGAREDGAASQVPAAQAPAAQAQAPAAQAEPPRLQPVTPSAPIPAYSYAPSAPATAGLAVPSGPVPAMPSGPVPAMPSVPVPYAPPTAEAPAAATLTPTPMGPPPTAPPPAFVAAPERADQSAGPAQPDQSGRKSDDPFAEMPRITPFTDFELDAVERPPSVPWGGDATVAASSSRLGGRHATAAVPPSESSGGRRRRADDSDNDVLARILAREKHGTGEDD